MMNSLEDNVPCGYSKYHGNRAVHEVSLFYNRYFCHLHDAGKSPPRMHSNHTATLGIFLTTSTTVFMTSNKIWCGTPINSSPALKLLPSQFDAAHVDKESQVPFKDTITRRETENEMDVTSTKALRLWPSHAPPTLPPPTRPLPQPESSSGVSFVNPFNLGTLVRSALGKTGSGKKQAQMS